MTIILDRFEADYIDVQGDGIFGLFSGPNSHFNAAACAITMRTQVEREVDARFRKATSGNRKLRVGIGMDRGTLLVRRLGLRGSKMNEVWAGTPVNMAAKLSSIAGPNQVVMSERLFSEYEKGSKLRQRALMWSCGCKRARSWSRTGPSYQRRGVSLATGVCPGELRVGFQPSSPVAQALVSNSRTGVLRGIGHGETE